MLIAFTVCCNIFASAQIPKLIVWMDDGSKVTYELNELPKTVFEGDNMVITTSLVTASYPASQVRKYTYEGDFADNIEEVGSNGVCIVQKGNVYTIKNLKPGDTVNVYGVDGVEIMNRKVHNGVPVVVSLENLQNGVYVIKINDNVHKVMKR